MGEIRAEFIKQQMQRELEVAKKLEADGKGKEAGVHYAKAGTIARKLAYVAPRDDAEDFFSQASQYESVGTIMKSTTGHMRAQSPEMIDQMIVTQKPSITWEDIGGLDEAKHVLREAIIMPFIKSRPEFLQTSRSILLYGPPGTGKTLLAKASSNTLEATFFEAKASGLLSKYFGESTKLVSALFEKAKKMQPSLVFMDEVDSLAPSRSGGIDESSRRVLGQILSELDGFGSGKDDKIIFMGATNKPWDLDDALLSRFQRRIYVPLPDEESRKLIFAIHTKGLDLRAVDMKKLIEATGNYSGRDISNLCQETISLMVREQNPDLESLTAKQLDSYALKYRGLTQEDFEKALEKVKPVMNAALLKKYEDWEEQAA